MPSMATSDELDTWKSLAKKKTKPLFGKIPISEQYLKGMQKKAAKTRKENIQLRRENEADNFRDVLALSKRVPQNITITDKAVREATETDMVAVGSIRDVGLGKAYGTAPYYKNGKMVRITAKDIMLKPDEEAAKAKHEAGLKAAKHLKAWTDGACKKVTCKNRPKPKKNPKMVD